MAIIDRGEPAVSFTGSQAGIVTDTAHRKAKILEIRGDRIREALGGGQRRRGRRLPGRVHRARHHHARPRWLRHHRGRARRRARAPTSCEIYTDVAGRLHRRPAHRARRAPARAAVLRRDARDGGHRRARARAALGRVRRATTGCRSTCGRASRGRRAPGCTTRSEVWKQPIISGVTHDVSEAKVTIFRVPDRPGIAAKLFRALADENVNVDMIEQNVSTDGHTDISFTDPAATSSRRTMEVVDKVVVEIDAGGANFDDAIGRVSLVGAGMKTNPGVAAQMFETLAAESVNIEMISTSTIRISCVVHENDVERAVQALHAAFELETREPRGDVVASASSGRRVSSAPRCCGCSRSGRSRSTSCAPTRRRARRAGRCRSPDGEVVCEVLARRLLRRPRPRRDRRRRPARARVGAACRRQRCTRRRQLRRVPHGRPTSRSWSPR